MQGILRKMIFLKHLHFLASSHVVSISINFKYMKGYPAVPCRKATAGEQMVWRWSGTEWIGLLPKHLAGNQIYIYTYWEKLALVKDECENVWEQNVWRLFDYAEAAALYLNKLYLLLLFCSDPGSGWIIAPVFTPGFLGFRTPQRGRRRGRRPGGMEKEQRGHLLMIQRTGPHCG